MISRDSDDLMILSPYDSCQYWMCVFVAFAITEAKVSNLTEVLCLLDIDDC